MVWKNTMATDRAEGEPPSRGSTILVNIGSIWNNSAALRKMAAMKVASSVPGDWATRRIVSAAGGSAMVRPVAATLTIARGPSIGPAMMMVAQETLLRRRRARAPARA